MPAPVDVAEAEDASARSPLLEHHPFGTCFVCGTERGAGDGMRLFAGPVEGRDLYAAPWTPDAWLADGDGAVRAEFAWSVLDCPSGNVIALMDTRQPVRPGAFGRQLVAPIEAGAEHVAVGWPISQERRKLHTGAAIFTAGGGAVRLRTRAVDRAHG